MQLASLEYDVLQHPCLHTSCHHGQTYSEAAACMRQNMCTVDHHNPSFYYLALPCPHIISAAYTTFIPYTTLLHASLLFHAYLHS
jgi:hypothetical protein